MSEETRNTRCQELGEDLVLHLYDELSEAERTALDSHLAICNDCREELRSSRDALQTIDSARIDQMATFRLPSWDDLEDELAFSLAPLPLAAKPRRFGGMSTMAKAASILLLAGGAFIAGLQWNSIADAIVQTASTSRTAQPPHPLDGTASGAAPLPAVASAGDRMRAFTEQTHGYFQRSRLVLLEFANSDQISDGTMSAASRNLLRETASARRVAGQIHDERIQDLVVTLEEILTRIASNDTDAAERARLRSDVEDLLGRLELTAPPERFAQERSRT